MSELRLPPSTESVPVARRFAREQLRHSQSDVDTVVLLVSEVVTNAVLHAHSEVVLLILQREDVTRIEVSDASPVPPRLHNFTAESATGRGLRLLDQLALRWGADAASSGTGKVVWFEVGSASDTSWEAYGEALMAEGALGDL